MNLALTKKLKALWELLRSPRGKNIATFAVFLGISAVLWLVLSLNETAQRDLRCPVQIINVPDSLTRVSPLPEAINVSVKVRTASVLSYSWQGAPTINIDYRTYASRSSLNISSSTLRGIVRGIIGNNSEIVSLSPDTIAVDYTNSRGVLLPIHVDWRIETASQYTLAGTPKPSQDSVRVYSLHGIPRGTTAINTKAIVIENLSKDLVARVPLIAPNGCRAVPDSVDVNIKVDPLVSKSVDVPITPAVVPGGYRLITMPATVTVNYMLPMSVYKTLKEEPAFIVEIRYDEIDQTHEKAPVKLSKVPSFVTNAFLDKDSVMYLIEHVQ